MPQPMRTCPECAARFAQAHHRQLFCSAPHQKAYNNRRTSRGHRLVTLAMASRAMRGGTRGASPQMRQAAKEAYMLMHRLLDQYIAEDKAAGRMHPTAMFDMLQRFSMLEW